MGGSGIKVCAKGLGSPGASSIRGRPRFRFMINGSKVLAAVWGPVEGMLKSVGSTMDNLGFLGLDALDGSTVEEEADEELGVVVIAFETFVEVDAAGIKLVLDSLSLDVTSAKPLILRFSAVFDKEANWC